ncbi:SusC/RagA family TonB-linked outer membrane protein [Flavobacterium sp.]|uniref:SusC/RagA family TonB-linked outer membrane protein n=1 Tax=Flavobacterium sp. TaxID=239 RepID=UPI003C690298
MNFKKVQSLKWKQLRKIVFVNTFGVFTVLGMGQNVLANENKIKDAILENITLSVDNEPLKDVFKKIEAQSNVHFMYETNQVNNTQKVSLKVNNLSLNQVMEKLCTPLFLNYQIINRNIVIKKANTSSKNSQRKYKISGTVIGNDDGLPLPGVNVNVKDSKIGITTDFDGTFVLTLDEPTVTLIFSYVGYADQELKVDGTTSNLNIRLLPGAKQLQEVVVVGYGSVKRSQITGAVSTVSLKESSSRTYNSTAELLQGTVAGVTVLNSGGDPTAPPKVIIRGIGSINSEEPMIVLDGMIFSGSFNDINPNDIEAISVLKDAASAAIYGARASGGVILITTKKGRTGSVNVNVNYKSGMQQLGKKIEALNAAELVSVRNQAFANDGLSNVYADLSKNPELATTNTVWTDEIFRVGKIQDVAMSVDGGNDKATFFLSGGYRKNEGILLNTFSQRYTARANSTFKISPKIKIGENLTYSLTDGQSGSTEDAYTSPIISAVFYTPYGTIYKPDGSGEFSGIPSNTGASYGDVANPVATLLRLDNSNPVSTLLINPYAEWEIVKGLTFKTNWGFTRIQNNSKDFQVRIPEPGKPVSFNQLIEKSSTRTRLLSEQTLTYDKSFGGHNITAFAGYTYQDDKSNYFSATGTDFDDESPSKRYLINAKNFKNITGSGTEENLLSYVGRLNYSFKDKYLLSAVIRRDGTSKLTADNRWKTYPSLSLGWLISEEDFMENSKSIVSVLKLRASDGTIGNLAGVGTYSSSVALSQTKSLLGSTPITVLGLAESELSNSQLTWESSRQKNIGLDFGLFKNSFTGSVDYFVKTNKDMLFRNSLPGNAGVPGGQLINAGEVENKGLEVSLGFNKEIGNFKMDVAVNVSFLDNKIVALKEGQTSFFPEKVSGSRTNLPVANIYQIDQPINAFYGYVADGLFQSNDEVKGYTNAQGVLLQPKAVAGDIKFVDTNGDGTIDDKDRTVIGNPFPKKSYSVNFNFNYKRFDMNLFFQGVAGNSVNNSLRFTGINTGLPNYNLLAEVKDAWSPTNTDTSIPRLTTLDPNNNFTRISSLYIEDASFLRLKNITVGYTFNEEFFNNKMKARIYFSAQNLFTITKYSGQDPEVGLNNSGIDLGRYPLSKIFLTGVNLSF